MESDVHAPSGLFAGAGRTSTSSENVAPRGASSASSILHKPFKRPAFVGMAGSGGSGSASLSGLGAPRVGLGGPRFSLGGRKPLVSVDAGASTSALSASSGLHASRPTLGAGSSASATLDNKHAPRLVARPLTSASSAGASSASSAACGGAGAGSCSSRAAAGDDGDDGDDDCGDAPMSQKAVNTSLMARGDVEVKYAPVMPFLTVPDRKAALYRPFKLPAGVERTAGGPRKILGGRRAFRMPTPPSAFIKPRMATPDDEADAALLAAINADTAKEEAEGEAAATAAAAPAPVVAEAAKFEPLVLWTPPADGSAGPKATPISVDPLLCRFLREHQREGVQFMFECTHGLRAFGGNGCILADDMGLGKTLQSITLLYTVLRQGMSGSPTARRAIVVCPTSLVANWAKEINKWVGDRIRCIALAEASRDKATMDINTFLTSFQFPVLIISYETFRMHAAKFQAKADACDLLICDEAHRLKNDATQTTQALAGLACRRRILLSGTPMQNDLDEFWAMADFTNPGVLGDAAAFRKRFASPILAAREPWASERTKAAGDAAGKELSGIVNQFILRRTNALLSAHLPPKLMQVVCVRLSPLQRALYDHFLNSKELHLIMSGKQSGVLASITALRKLVNHPRLIFDALRAKAAAARSGGGTRRSENEAAGFEDCESVSDHAVACCYTHLVAAIYLSCSCHEQLSALSLCFTLASALSSRNVCLRSCCSSSRLTSTVSAVPVPSCPASLSLRHAC